MIRKADHLKVTSMMLAGAAFCLVAIPLSAAACRYKIFPLDVNVARADEVITARVVRASNGRTAQAPLVPAVVEVLHVTKGRLHRGDLVEVTTSATTCGLGFKPGQVWFILASGQPLGSDAPSGSLMVVSEQGVVQRDNVNAVKALFEHAIEGIR